MYIIFCTGFIFPAIIVKYIINAFSNRIGDYVVISNIDYENRIVDESKGSYHKKRLSKKYFLERYEKNAKYNFNWVGSVLKRFATSRQLLSLKLLKRRGFSLDMQQKQDYEHLLTTNFGRCYGLVDLALLECCDPLKLYFLFKRFVLYVSERKISRNCVNWDVFVYKQAASVTIQRHWRGYRCRNTSISSVLNLAIHARAVVSIQRCWKFYASFRKRTILHGYMLKVSRGFHTNYFYMDSWIYYLALNYPDLPRLSISALNYPEFRGVPFMTDGDVTFTPFLKYMHTSDSVENITHIETGAIYQSPTAQPASSLLQNNFLFSKVASQESLNDIMLLTPSAQRKNRFGPPRWMSCPLPFSNEALNSRSSPVSANIVRDLITIGCDVQVVEVTCPCPLYTHEQPLSLQGTKLMMNLVKMSFKSVAEARARAIAVIDD